MNMTDHNAEITPPRSPIGRRKSAVKMKWLAVLALLPFLPGCASNSTRALPPVSGFAAGRYVGTWYEIARFPHVFERGLSNVTAEYTAQPDGSIRVVNKGYNQAKQKWQSATARAVFPGARDTGLLRVTFFWPFAAVYKVIRLDEQDYGWAVVASGTYDYFWILARTPQLPPATYNALVKFAADSGFDISRIEKVAQDAQGAE